MTVVRRTEVSPRLLGLTFEGPDLADLVVDHPAASVRLLVPSPGSAEVVWPSWNGNEFLLPDGTRPALRTFTPRRLDRAAGRLELEVVRHPGGVVSDWAETVEPGARAAISGPGSGYEIEPDVARYLLLGDETALPAISQLLESLPTHASVEVHVEVVVAEAEIELPAHPGATVSWHVRPPGAAPGAPLVAVVAALDGVDPGTRVWAAGEAASMQAIRTRLFDALAVPRAQTTIRGYWKPPRRA